MQHPEDPWGPDDPDEAGFEPIEPEDFLPGNPFPTDAQRLGIDRWSDNAGMIAVASSLDPAKRWHKAVAWVMLVAVVVWTLATLWSQLSSH